MDCKLFICRKSDPAFSAEMDARMQRGSIVPFAVLFRHAVEFPITNKDKSEDKDIIQFGFLVSDGDGNVLLMDRTPLSATAEAGHSTSTKYSVLVGWSPVGRLPGCHPYPMSENDVRWAYHHEVNDTNFTKPDFRFLGLVRNDIKGIRFYFYIFHVSYVERSPDLGPLRKDKDDVLCGFFAPDLALAEKVKGMKADLRALELLTKHDLSQFGYGSSQVAAFTPGMKPPFRIHAPDVFISHATADHEDEAQIRAALVDVGITCWSDQDILRGGDQWFDEIHEGIKYCAVFIVLCSENILTSSGVAAEVALAMARKQRDHNFPIVPVSLKGESIEEFIPKVIAQYHGIDLRDHDNAPQSLAALVMEIRRFLVPYSGREQ